MYTQPCVSCIVAAYATMQTDASSFILPTFQMRAQHASHNRMIAVLLEQPALAANLAADNLPYEPNLLLRALHHLFLSKQMLKRNPLPTQNTEHTSTKIHIRNRDAFL